MFWDILDYLRELNVVSITFRIVLAMVIGGVLGVERGRKQRPAGFRTYMLVSVGATLVMMTNQYAHDYFGTSDVVRMGAQVVSGIGFLGAGTIIVTRRNQVKGITTAAGLWAAACSGLAIGIGFYEGALVGGIAVLVIMAFMEKLDNHIHSRSRFLELYVEYDSDRMFSELLDYAAASAIDVEDLQMAKTKLGRGTAYSAVLRVKSRVKRSHSDIVQQLSQAPGVLHMEEL